MTNVGCTGQPRNGKTLKSVELAFRAYKSGYAIISAVRSLKLPHIEFDGNKILDAFERKISIQRAFDIPEGKYTFLFLDEITALGGHARMFSGQSNIVLGFLFMQAGKRRLSLCWTAQLFDSVDKIDRNLTNTTFDCVRIGAEKDPLGFRLHKLRRDGTLGQNGYKWWSIEQARPYFKYYDTEEAINPTFPKKK